jgi:hypothetical protein
LVHPGRLFWIDQRTDGDPEDVGDLLQHGQPIELTIPTLGLVDPADRLAHAIGEDLTSEPPSAHPVVDASADVLAAVVMPVSHVDTFPDPRAAGLDKLYCLNR